MTTLTWLFFTLSFAAGGFLSNRLTKWYYKRKFVSKDELHIYVLGAYWQAKQDVKDVWERDIVKWLKQRSLHWLRLARHHPEFENKLSDWMVEIKDETKHRRPPTGTTNYTKIK